MADGFGGLRLQNRLALRRQILLQKAHRQQFAVVGEDGVAACQLQQAHLQAVAERHGGLLNRPPSFPVAHQTGAFTRKARMQAAAETHGFIVVVHFFGLEHGRQAAGAHIRRFLQNAAHVQRAVIMSVAHRGATNLVGIGVKPAVGIDFACVQRLGHRERLHGAARLNHIGDCAVAAAVAVGTTRIIGVVAGGVHQCQDFAGFGVQHHCAAGLGLMVNQCFVQLFISNRLDALIQR